MKGKVQQQFIRDLHRKIESIVVRNENPEAVTLEDPSGYVGGIRIVSNLITPPLQQDVQLWHTINEAEAEEFETESED
jgi:hypothetical protein